MTYKEIILKLRKENKLYCVIRYSPYSKDYTWTTITRLSIDTSSSWRNAYTSLRHLTNMINQRENNIIYSLRRENN